MVSVRANQYSYTDFSANIATWRDYDEQAKDSGRIGNRTDERATAREANHFRTGDSSALYWGQTSATILEKAGADRCESRAFAHLLFHRVLHGVPDLRRAEGARGQANGDRSWSRRG